LGIVEEGWEKWRAATVLEHKSGNISETRKDGGKVTMGEAIRTANLADTFTGSNRTKAL